MRQDADDACAAKLFNAAHQWQSGLQPSRHRQCSGYLYDATTVHKMPGGRTPIRWTWTLSIAATGDRGSHKPVSRGRLRRAGPCDLTNRDVQGRGQRHGVGRSAGIWAGRARRELGRLRQHRAALVRRFPRHEDALASCPGRRPNFSLGGANVLSSPVRFRGVWRTERIVGLTNVWVRTLSDGLIRADNIVGIDAHRTLPLGKAHSLAAGCNPAGSGG